MYYKTLKKLIFTFTVVTIAALIIAGTGDDRDRNVGDINKTLMVKIYGNENTLESLSKMGIAADHVDLDKSTNSFIAYLNGAEVKQMKDAGIIYEIVYGDWYEDYYSKIPTMTDAEKLEQIEFMERSQGVTGFGYGSMGGFYTYNEVIRKIDSMRLQYPDLISAKFSIGTAFSGNQIWAYKITKNPDVPNNRPQVLYTSLIHSREAITVMNLMYFSYYLLENYNTDDIAKYLVDNREMYFIPFVNPDGYRYNQKHRPNGGGMRRKNLNGADSNVYQPSTGGIDLNRNFGTYQFWNSPNGGSSTNPNSDTYRGTAPFSEPETQSILNFVNSKNFKNSLFYHSYSNLYIYPWAWIDPQQTPDSTIFQNFSNYMAGFNGYLPGVASQTVGYEVRGGSDDWLYNDSGHTKIIGITPEIGTGSDGFWPQQNRIFPLVMENLNSNIFYSGAADTFAAFESYALNSGETLEAGDTSRFHINVKSVGLKNASSLIAHIESLDTMVTILENDKSFGPFTFFETKDNSSNPFVIKVNSSIQNGMETKLLVKLKLGEYYITRDTITFTLGTPTVLFKDTVNTVSPLWTASGTNSNNTWATTTSDFVSPPFSYTDSPFGNYGINVTNVLTLNNPVNLNNLSNIKLMFNTKYFIESGYDYGQVEITTNNGGTWIPLQGKYTKPGAGSFQPNGEPLYDGSTGTWKSEVMSLTPYSNHSVKIRFYFRSDGGLNLDGWYVDDICILGYDVQTGITGNGELPVTYSLSQNYPNPFNPVTQISYSIPSKQFVSIKVFDMLGRQVSQLVNNINEAGNYSVTFDGSAYSSGIYYYKMETEGFVETRRMVLVK